MLRVCPGLGAWHDPYRGTRQGKVGKVPNTRKPNSAGNDAEHDPGENSGPAKKTKRNKTFLQQQQTEGHSSRETRMIILQPRWFPDVDGDAKECRKLGPQGYYSGRVLVLHVANLGS